MTSPAGTPESENAPLSSVAPLLKTTPSEARMMSISACRTGRVVIPVKPPPL